MELGELGILQRVHPSSRVIAVAMHFGSWSLTICWGMRLGFPRAFSKSLGFKRPEELQNELLWKLEAWAAIWEGVDG